MTDMNDTTTNYEDVVIHRLSVGTKDNDNDKERLKGIHAVVAPAHNKAGRHNMSRQELMRL